MNGRANKQCPKKKYDGQKTALCVCVCVCVCMSSPDSSLTGGFKCVLCVSMGKGMPMGVVCCGH